MVGAWLALVLVVGALWRLRERLIYPAPHSLHAIRAKGQPPLYILHGARDSFIPHEMGEAVARAAPGSHFELVPGADHADVIDVAEARLRELLAERDPG